MAVLIDLVFIILWVRILYVAVSRGILAEIIKIAGLLAGIFFAFQYYTFSGEKLGYSIPFLGKEYFNLAAFLIIFLGTRAIFSFLGLITRLLFKSRDIAIFERWLSLFAGTVRAILLSSVIVFAFHLSPFDLLVVQKSRAVLFAKPAPWSYLAIYRFFSTTNAKMKVNPGVEQYLDFFKPGNRVKGGGLEK